MNKKIFSVILLLSGCSIQLLSSNRNLKFTTLNHNMEMSIPSFCTEYSENYSQIRIDKIIVEEPYSSYRLYIQNEVDTLQTLDSYQWISSLAHLYPHRVKKLINACATQTTSLPKFTTDISSKSRTILDLSLTSAQFSKIENVYHAHAQIRCSMRNEISGQLTKLMTKEINIKLENSLSSPSSIKALNNAIDQATIDCLSELTKENN